MQQNVENIKKKINAKQITKNAHIRRSSHMHKKQLKSQVQM